MGIESNTREKIGSTAASDKEAVPCAITSVNAEGQQAHTPGPWRLERPRSGHKIHVSGFGWLRFARVWAEVGGQPNAEGEANARLIAAAPEMLEALKKARDGLMQLPASLAFEITHIREIDAVIAKATGQALAQSLSTEGAIGEHGGNSP